MNWHHYLVNLLTFTTGSVLSWASPVIPKISTITEDNPLGTAITATGKAWLVALLPFGSIFGCPVGGILSSKFGKKKALIISSIPLLITYILYAFGMHLTYYLIARFLGGLSVGICFTLIPLYIGETADKITRGKFGCFFGIFLKLGTVSSYIIGPYVSVKAFSLISAIPVIVFLIAFSLYFPETPYHLVSTGRNDKAEKVLKKIRKGNDEETIKEELLEIHEYVKERQSIKNNVNTILSSKAAARSLLVSVGILTFQQLSGIVVILSYLQPILEESATSIPPSTASSVIGVIQFVIALAASQLVDKFGRRILLTISCALQTSALLLLGLFFCLKNNDVDMKSFYWLPISSVVLYFLGFSMGLGPVGWTLMGELFDSDVKSLAAPVANTISKTSSFIITMAFPYLAANCGIQNGFWLLAGFTFLALIFVILFVPETKHKSFKEIQIDLEENLIQLRKR